MYIKSKNHRHYPKHFTIIEKINELAHINTWHVYTCIITYSLYVYNQHLFLRSHFSGSHEPETPRYSMGGFGAFQLGCRAPDTFDAIISVAGYGMGTNSKDAPQPYSGAFVRKKCGGESHWNMVNFVGTKWCWENDMFWMSLKISIVFWRLHSGKNGVAKRKGRYTQHLGIPNKQVSIYVYMPLFKVRSISCVSSNFFIEQTGCFWLPYQISISKAVSFGTSFRKKPQRWQRSLWCWPSMQRTTVCPPMMMSAS